jgi:hypothetical protein
MDHPATRKALTGFDADVQNTWTLTILSDPRDITQHVNMGDIAEFSYDSSNTDGVGEFTHMAPKLVCSAAGYARLSSFAIHYEMSQTAG